MAYQGRPGGHPQIGTRHQGHRRHHRGHHHARRRHALDRLHLAGSPQPAADSRLRSERGLLRLALRRVDGPRHDPLRHGPQRAHRGRRVAVAALGPGGSQRLFPLRRRRRGGHYFRRQPPATASATRCSAPTRAAADGPPLRARLCHSQRQRRRPRGGEGSSIRGSASTATPCSVSPPRVSPASFAARLPRPAGRWTRPAGWFRTRPTAGFSSAAAKRCGVDFQRFALNVENVGNTSSASIPLTLIDVESSLQPGDKLILCAVGAGMTTAAISVEW